VSSVSWEGTREISQAISNSTILVVVSLTCENFASVLFSKINYGKMNLLTFIISKSTLEPKLINEFSQKFHGLQYSFQKHSSLEK
jgi:hypothetical protein